MAADVLGVVGGPQTNGVAVPILAVRCAPYMISTRMGVERA
jgi:hypothetical protein